MALGDTLLHSEYQVPWVFTIAVIDIILQSSTMTRQLLEVTRSYPLHCWVIISTLYYKHEVQCHRFFCDIEVMTHVAGMVIYLAV